MTITTQFDSPDHIQRTDNYLIIIICLIFFSIPISTALTSILNIVFLSCWIITGGWKKSRDWWLTQLRYLLPIICVIVLPLIALIWSIAPKPDYKIILDKNFYWLLAIVCSYIVINKRHYYQIFIFFIVGVEFNVLMIWLTHFGVMERYNFLNSFMYSGYITYSLLLVFSSVLLSFFASKERYTIRRYFIVSIILINIISLSLLNGRSGYIAFFLMSPVIISNIFCINGWRLSAVYLIIISFFCLAPKVQIRISAAIHETRAYFNAPANEIPISSAGVRLFYWKNGLHIFANNPFVGVGTGGYRYAMKALYPNDPNKQIGDNPHSQYIYILANYGLLGIACYGYLLLQTLRKSWSYRKELGGFAATSGILIICIGGMTDAAFLCQATGVLMSFLTGFALTFNDRSFS